MKKFITALFLLFSFAAVSFAARAFVEGTDYSVDYKPAGEGRADAIHVVFTGIMPAPAEAETIIKDQLKVYGKIIETEKENAKKEAEELEKSKEAEAAKDKKKDKSKPKPKEAVKEIPKSVKDIKTLEDFNAYYAAQEANEEKFKNIIGSVWYSADGTPEKMEKINYSDNSSAFVWIGKTQRVISFPDYIKYLKKDKDDKKQKEKEKAQLLKLLLKQEAAPETDDDDEAQP